MAAAALPAAALPFTTADAEARYETLISEDASLKSTFLMKYSYDKWRRDDLFDAVSTLETPIHHWVGPEMYTINYAIKWSLYKNGLGYPNTTSCHGDKCRRDIDASITNWCTACHGDPCDMDVFEFILLMITEEPFTDLLQFRHLYYFDDMVDSVSATVTRVADPDRSVHSAKIANDLKTRTETITETSVRLDQLTHKITTLSEQMVEVETFLTTGPPPLIQDILHREKNRMVESSARLTKEKLETASTLVGLQSDLDTLHTAYGFESRAAMEAFLMDMHSKAAADLLAKVRAKLAV